VISCRRSQNNNRESGVSNRVEGVPVAPGRPEALDAAKTASAPVDALGYPGVLKAAASGGNR